MRQPFAEGLFLRTSAGPRFVPEPRKWKARPAARRITAAEERETIPFMRITQTHGALLRVGRLRWTSDGPRRGDGGEEAYRACAC